MARLLETAPPSRDKDTCQYTVIEGLGGIGKTQIVLEAAFRIRDQCPDCSIFWVPAVDVATFENAYLKIGRHLNLQGLEDSEVDVMLLVKEALEDSAWEWLLIIDNADDEKLFFEGPAPLYSFLPFSSRGSIIFTTRNHHVAVHLDTPNISNLGKLGRHDSIKLFLKRLTDSQVSCDTDTLNTLLDYLADLPLAIRQASAFMAKQQTITVRMYLNFCQSSDKELIKLLSKDFGDRGRYEHAENPIATTWLISFRQILRDNPLAIRYLEYMSFLREKDIPMSILPPVPSVLDSYEAVGTLQAYGFITKQESSTDSDSDRLYTVHRLVHVVMRNWLEERGELEKWVTVTIRIQLTLFPHPEHNNKSIWMKYLPHIARTLEFRRYSTDRPATTSLLIKMHECYRTLGLYRKGAWAGKEALYSAAESLDNGEITTLLNEIKKTSKGDLKKEFESVTQLTRELLLKLQVTEHASTPCSMSVLAQTCLDKGNLQDAMITHQKALDLLEKKFGPEDTAALTAMSNFARALLSHGNHEEAEMVRRQSLALQKKVLGVKHLDTLTGIYNLAETLLEREKYQEADSMLRDALNLLKQMNSLEHPLALQCMSKLGLVLYRQERYDQAETLLREAVELQKRVLGDGHPDLLVTLMNLALTLRAVRKDEEAEATKQVVDSFVGQALL